VPTLVIALTLVSLVRLGHLDYKPWELALLLALIAGVVLWGSLTPTQWALNIGLMYAAVTAWLWGLQATDHIGGQALHWLLLIGGFVLLVGSRLYLDMIVYGIGF
jgi:hypothetical protein